MLNRDSSFDEGALGFSKFSRFIRQAHDEEVVDITKDSDGNYYLQPVGGAGQAARAGQGVEDLAQGLAQGARLDHVPEPALADLAGAEGEVAPAAGVLPRQGGEGLGTDPGPGAEVLEDALAG